MLSAEDNDQLRKVGPGSVGGDLLRQYWLPANGRAQRYTVSHQRAADGRETTYGQAFRVGSHAYRLGCGRFGAPADPVVIGMPMALTGYLAAFDSHAVEGARLAANLLNANGGTGGHPIELKILDNSSNATTGVTITNELIYKHDVAAIASGALSAQTVAIEPIVTRNKIPVVTMSIIPAEMQWTFSIALPPPKLLDLELGFAAQNLKAKRIAFLYSQTPYGQVAAGIVADTARKHGLEAVFNEGVAVASTDLTPQVARLKESKPEATVDFLTGPT